MTDSIHCRKCGKVANWATRYEGPRQHQHGGPTTPECLRLTCNTCGWSYTTPTADARAEPPTGHKT